MIQTKPNCGGTGIVPDIRDNRYDAKCTGCDHPDCPIEKPNERKIVYWDCDQHREQLYHETIKDAIEYHLDDVRLSNSPTELTVYGFVRMSVILDSEDILVGVLEGLDEEHADADGDSTFPTKAMKAAAEIFAEAILSEYECWSCEMVVTRTVKVSDYVQAGM